MADDSSDSSPQQSPSSDSPPPPPPSSSDSSTSPPTSSDSSSSSPPPSSPPPPSDDSSSGGDSSGNSSPSPPPPDSSSSSGSPPPPSSEGSQSSPPPPSERNNDGGSGESQSKSPPAPAEKFVAPAPPGSRPHEQQPPLAPPRSTDNQTSNGYSPSESPSSSPSSSSNGTAVIVGLVVAGGLLILLVIACVLCSRRKRRKPTGGPPYGWESAPPPQGTKHTGNQQYWQSSAQDHAVKIPPNSGAWGHTSGGGDESGGPYSGGQMNTPLAPSPSLTLGFNKSTFTYEELAAATNNFDRSRMLGQGGFGYVHKGMLPNGKEIAVKSLKSGSGQGEREFQSEVEIISRVHHRHLVSLVGYCIAGGQRMLVYEFVPNDTLEYHLHKKSPPLDFSTRVRIALGSAKGLGYLHEDCHPRIIHRDIKASNILLDENYEAMVADFGLAKLTTDTNTHVSTRVMGTFGYLAPEYASSGKLTEKSDVFSYGVMLLELITGRRPVDPNMKYMEDSLVDWSRPLLAKALETGNYDELADARLERNYNPQEMQRMVACAAASIRHSAKKRPKMSQIVRALEGDVSLDDLNNEGGKPGQGAFSSSEGSDYDTRAYSADLKKFRQMAFATQDFASSEYGGGTTSEYGLNPSSSSSDNSTRDMNSEKLHPKF